MTPLERLLEELKKAEIEHEKNECRIGRTHLAAFVAIALAVAMILLAPGIGLVWRSLP